MSHTEGQHADVEREVAEFMLVAERPEVFEPAFEARRLTAPAELVEARGDRLPH